MFYYKREVREEKKKDVNNTSLVQLWANIHAPPLLIMA